MDVTCIKCKVCLNVIYLIYCWKKTTLNTHKITRTHSTGHAARRLNITTGLFGLSIYSPYAYNRMYIPHTFDNDILQHVSLMNYCFSAKHGALRRKNKDWLGRNRDNVSEWSDMSIHGLLVQWASTIKIQLSVYKYIYSEWVSEWVSDIYIHTKTS
jgi:hypothetical protein